MRTTRKRYLLLEAAVDLTLDNWNEVAGHIVECFGGVKVIAVKGSDRAFIVKTDVASAKIIRSNCGSISAGPVGLKSLKTSGSIGKLKRLASGSGPT